MYHRHKCRKIYNQERWYLWIAFLSIDKNSFSCADPPEQQRWIVWLAEHFRDLSMQMRSSAPRGQVTDEAEVTPAGSVVTANNPQPSVSQQAALLGADHPADGASMPVGAEAPPAM